MGKNDSEATLLRRGCFDFCVDFDVVGNGHAPVTDKTLAGAYVIAKEVAAERHLITLNLKHHELLQANGLRIIRTTLRVV